MAGAGRGCCAFCAEPVIAGSGSGGRRRRLSSPSPPTEVSLNEPATGPANSRRLSSQDRRYPRHRDQRRLSRQYVRRDAQRRSRQGAADPDRRLPAGAAHQRQHLPDPFQRPHRDRRHRLGKLHAAQRRHGAAKSRRRRDRSEVDRHRAADAHASGSFRRADRHVERQDCCFRTPNW